VEHFYASLFRKNCPKRLVKGNSTIEKPTFLPNGDFYLNKRSGFLEELERGGKNAVSEEEWLNPMVLRLPTN